tara:strand:+ start:231 stop:683 length:453 start_codon:yes stop_codon:yes gene_type:complete
MTEGRNASDTEKLPEWVRRMYVENGSPDLNENKDNFHGPLIDRKHGLRKDDLIEITIDNRALTKDEDRKVGGMLIGTTRNSVDILDSNGNFISIARDVIVQIKIIAHMRKSYLEDDELLTFEKEDMRRRANVQEKAEKNIEGRRDGHIWD